MLQIRKMAKKFTIDQIKKLIQDKPADMAITEYCASIGLHTRLFYYHRKKMREARQDGVSTNGATTASTKKRSSGDFMALKVKGGVDSILLAKIVLPSEASILVYDSAIWPSLMPLLM